MDFLDFDDDSLYFDEPLTKEQEELLQQASEYYPEPKAERLLDRLYALKPDSLTVLVERIREKMEHHAFDTGDGQVVRTTCSIGLPGL